MNELIDTNFGLVIRIDRDNKNIEINNKLNGSVTIITTTGHKFEL